MLEELVRRAKKNMVWGSWFLTIVLGIIALAALLFLVWSPFAKTPRILSTWLQGIVLVAFFTCLILREWLWSLPRTIRGRREQFAEALANKERLEREFTELEIMIHQKGDASEIKLIEMATRASRWGWGAAVHNSEFPEGSYPELRVDFKNHAF